MEKVKGEPWEADAACRCRHTRHPTGTYAYRVTRHIYIDASQRTAHTTRSEWSHEQSHSGHVPHKSRDRGERETHQNEK